jgi:hypothetical protein
MCLTRVRLKLRSGTAALRQSVESAQARPCRAARWRTARLLSVTANHGGGGHVAAVRRGSRSHPGAFRAAHMWLFCGLGGYSSYSSYSSRCRIYLYLRFKAALLRGAGPALAPASGLGEARPAHAGPHPAGHADQDRLIRHADRYSAAVFLAPIVQLVATASMASLRTVAYDPHTIGLRRSLPRPGPRAAGLRCWWFQPGMPGRWAANGLKVL